MHIILLLCSFVTVILVGESKKTSAASIGDTSQTSPVSGKLIGSNSEQRLRHKDIFMQFGDRIPSKSSDQTSNRQMKTTKSSEATVKSAPTLIMSQVMTNITKEPSEKVMITFLSKKIMIVFVGEGNGRRLKHTLSHSYSSFK